MIQITEPSLEALIHQRLIAGQFPDVESVLRQALTDAPLPCNHCVQKRDVSAMTGAELLEVLMNSPFREVDLEPERIVLPISDPVQL